MEEKIQDNSILENEVQENPDEKPGKSKRDSQARDWVFVVNNPKLTEQEMFEYLKTLVNVRYFIFAREKGDGNEKNQGTEHHQGYIEFSSPKKFSTMKNSFSEKTIGVNAHIKPRYSKREDNVAYVKKIGKHTDKAHTRISEVFEHGDFVQDGERTDITAILQMVKDGASDMEIEAAFPSQMFRYPGLIEKARNRTMKQQFEETFRELTVTYIWGSAGSGKTRYVMEKHGYKNVYRVTEYEKGTFPFDDYAGQTAIVFEEFRSGVKIEQMLNYLDGYPLTLPARYANKIACFTQVYIVTNIPLSSQYPKIQAEQPETWKALLRRIHYIWEYDKTPTPLPLTRGRQQIMCLQPLSDNDPLCDIF